MTATLVLPGTASEADWHAARRNGISASEIAPLMGLSGWTSPYALYHRKLGNLPEQESDLSMRVGVHMESFVADECQDRNPDLTITGTGRELYAHPERPWQMATPDRMVWEFYEAAVGPSYGVTEMERLLAVLECKTDSSYDGWGEDGSDEIPVKYRCQVLWQCDVLGVDAWFLACLFMHSRKLRIYHGTIDDQAQADLELMRDEAAKFLVRLQGHVEPDVDWRPSTSDALKALHPSVVDIDVPVKRKPVIMYRAAIRAYKEAERRKQAAENVMRQLIGDGHRAVDWITGEVVARRDVYDLPEKTITRKASTVNRLVHVPPKASKS